MQDKKLESMRKEAKQYIVKSFEKETDPYCISFRDRLIKDLKKHEK